jgi:hypothetical protein
MNISLQSGIFKVFLRGECSNPSCKPSAGVERPPFAVGNDGGGIRGTTGCTGGCR